MDGIRSLHERIDELHRLVAGELEEGVHPEGIDAERMHSAGEWLHTRSLAGAALHAARAIPAWRRRTQGEAAVAGRADHRGGHRAAVRGA